jgi:UDPglucose 6-dehydrogenase
MKIAIIGTGYVGLVSGVCFAEMGNDVWCVDVNQEKINNLNVGVVPIYEPGLTSIIESNYSKQSLHFTTEISDAISFANICFIAVGTPMGEDGSADLKYVLQVAKSIGEKMTHHMYVIDKSTVPVGTAKKVSQMIQQQLDIRNSDLTFDVISNPEFLKEGSAVEDCLKPDRIVIGTDNDKATNMMQQLYAPFVRNNDNIIFMDIASAEMTKYAANSMLATKISFMNEMANICERIGADINKVRKGIGSDKRIGYSFIYAGCGYGGSCFPKDVQALIKTSDKAGYDAKILRAVEDVNRYQKTRISEKIVSKYGENLEGLTFAVWGLAFKPDTDDMRDSPSITIINDITSRGAKVKAYDPKAFNEAKTCYLKDNENVEYVESKYSALTNADALLLITEWKEFRNPDFDEMKSRMKSPLIFDGRNQYNSKNMSEMGFEYIQIGVGN